MSKKTSNTPQFSNNISSFLDSIDQTLRDFKWNTEEQRRMELLQTDYLHQLELEDMKYDERAKIATKLAICRKARRGCKDTIAALAPFVDFIQSDRGRQMINLLKEALGKTRKVEEKMKNRIYCPRVLDIPPIESSTETQNSRR